MRKTLALALACALAAGAAGLTGCNLLANPVKDANDAITKANGHLKKFQDSNAKVEELSSSLNQVDVTKAGAKTALEITAQLKAELAAEKGELEQASADMATLKKLDVKASFKKYADLEIAAIAAQMAVVDGGAVLYGQMEEMYTAIRDGKKTTRVTTQILDDISKSYTKLGELTDAAAKANATATDYFKNTVAKSE
jgi:hypothetical protein